ncbi:MAG: PAS domain S-box protein [Methylococcales bacterium]|nr:PAS domain S-box protein [Methylococcales bacterium]
MTTPSIKKQDAEILRKEAGQLLDEHRDNIRKQAEAMLSKTGADLKLMSSADIEKLVFEFQVHQIELELQNEELKRTHEELSASRDEFAQLYNLSPVAYLTLNAQGIIKKVNLAAIQLLGGSQEALVNKKLGKFIHPSDQDDYYLYLHDLVSGKNNQLLTVKLAIKCSPIIHPECPGFTLLSCARALCIHNNPFTYAELRGAVNNKDKNNIQICLAIQDITEYKHSQETISCLNEKLEQKILKQTMALNESNLDLTKKVAELEHSKRQYGNGKPSSMLFLMLQLRALSRLIRLASYNLQMRQ